MNKKIKKSFICKSFHAIIYCFFLLLILPADNLHAKSITLNGQASCWFTFYEESRDDALFGIRYIPEIMAVKPLSEGSELDASIAVNAYSSALLNSLNDTDVNEEVKLYRLWLRYTTPQLETRAGLQKINFGPARVLRSLRWFDHINPQDPLELTDGVSALLLRYYFLDNANLWLWGIKGDDDLKGLEIYRTDESKEEFGARYQFPIPKGELALSYNRRVVDESDWNASNTEIMSNGEENRYAVDANWDIEIGLWFEASAEQIKINSADETWRNLFTIGADYTLSSGVYLMYEHFTHSTGPKIDATDEISELSALLISYNIGIIDSIKGIGYYDWRNDNDYYYIDWQRTYDNWQINVSAFSNSRNDTDRLSGDGMQLMLTYNH
jgi:hypothetical protein